MGRRFASGLFLLVGLSIGLGAFGHGDQWLRHVSQALGGVAPRVFTLLELIWFWVSGTMLAFGVLLVWCWWRLRRGDRAALFVAWTVSAFYLMGGAAGMFLLGPFFAVFMVQALLLSSAAWMLRRPA